MPPDTPTTEPGSLRAGDRWVWRREDLTDYPAPGWVLTYRFKSATLGFEVVAAADGEAHAVDVAATTSAACTAGTYTWAARATSGSDARTVDSGQLVVLPDLFAGTATAALDLRSHARQALAAIEAVLLGRATLDQEEYSINGRSLKRTPMETLYTLRAKYAAEVESEAAAERLANGGLSSKRLRVRF